MYLKKTSAVLTAIFVTNLAIANQNINSNWLYVGTLNGNYIANAGGSSRTLNLLQDMQGMENVPSFILGGTLEGDMSSSHNSSQNSVPASGGFDNKNSSKAWIDTTRLAILANANNMFHAQARIDNTSSSNIKDATIIIGDLNKSPWYGSIGKEYVYSGDFIADSVYTNPLNYVYFKPGSLPEASIGYNKNNFNFDVTAFQGVIVTNPNNSSFDKAQSYSGQFAIHAGYDIPLTLFKWHISGGFINDIRNTQSGLTDLVATNGGKLPAVDISTIITKGQLSFATEYDQLLKNAQDAGSSYISNKKPGSYHMQVDYNFNWDKPITVFTGFSNTFNMQNLLGADIAPASGANKNQYTAGANVAINNQLTLGLEYADVRQYIWSVNNNAPKPTSNISRYNIITFDGTLIF